MILQNSTQKELKIETPPQKKTRGYNQVVWKVTVWLWQTQHISCHLRHVHSMNINQVKFGSAGASRFQSSKSDSLLANV